MERMKYFYIGKKIDGELKLVGENLPESLKTKFFSELRIGDKFWSLDSPTRTYEKVEDTVLKDGYVANARNIKTGKYTKFGAFLDREVGVVDRV